MLLSRIFNAWKDRALPKESRDVAVLDAQNLALSLVIHNQWHKNDNDNFVMFKVDMAYMEKLYFNKFLRSFRVNWQSFTREYAFTPCEWQRVKDAFCDAIPSDDPDDFENEAFDLMICTIGYPAQVLVRVVESDFDLEQPEWMPDHIMDIRVPVGGEHGMVHRITYGRLYDLVVQQYPLEDDQELHMDIFPYSSLNDYDIDRFSYHEHSEFFVRDYNIGRALENTGVLEARYQVPQEPSEHDPLEGFDVLYNNEIVYTFEDSTNDWSVHYLIECILQVMVYAVREGYDYGFDVDNADPRNFVLRINDQTWGEYHMCEDIYDFLFRDETLIHLEFSPQFVGMSEVMSEDDDL